MLLLILITQEHYIKLKGSKFKTDPKEILSHTLHSLWNSLPHDFIKATSLAAFRKGSDVSMVNETRLK